MSKMLKATTWTALALSMGLIFGCSSNSNLEAMVNEAKAAADAAKTEASSASGAAMQADAKAEEALLIAKEAGEKADKAYGVARAADYQVNRLAQKVDRMFKKSMYK
jgi:hypothetical protein